MLINCLIGMRGRRNARARVHRPSLNHLSISLRSTNYSGRWPMTVITTLMVINEDQKKKRLGS